MLGLVSDGFTEAGELCLGWIQRWRREQQSEAPEEAYRLYKLLDKGPVRSQRAHQEGFDRFGQQFIEGDDQSRESITQAQLRVKDKLVHVLNQAYGREHIDHLDFDTLESIAMRVDLDCLEAYESLIDRLHRPVRRQQLKVRTRGDPYTFPDGTASPSSASYQYHQRAYNNSKSPHLSGPSPLSQVSEQIIVSPQLTQSPVPEQSSRFFNPLRLGARNSPTNAVRSPTIASDAVLIDNRRHLSGYQRAALSQSRQASNSVETRSHHSPGMPSRRQSDNITTTMTSAENHMSDATPKLRSCPEFSEKTQDRFHEPQMPKQMTANQRSQTVTGLFGHRKNAAHVPSRIQTERKNQSATPYSAGPFPTKAMTESGDSQVPASAVEPSRDYLSYREQHSFQAHPSSSSKADRRAATEAAYLRQPAASFCANAMILQNADAAADWQTLFISNKRGPNDECRSCHLLVPNEGFTIICQRFKWEVSARFLAKCHATNPSGAFALLRCVLCNSTETFRGRDKLRTHMEFSHHEQDFQLDSDIKGMDVKTTSYSSISSDRSC